MRDTRRGGGGEESLQPLFCRWCRLSLLALHLGHLKGAKRDHSPWGSEQDPPASGLPAARASREAVLPSGIWEVSGFVLFPVTGSRLTAFM